MFNGRQRFFWKRNRNNAFSPDSPYDWDEFDLFKDEELKEANKVLTEADRAARIRRARAVRGDKIVEISKQPERETR
jgi:hypothetical protein